MEGLPAFFSRTPATMTFRISTEAGWTEEDLDVRFLNGPPPPGFDCGRAEQNDYLYQRAWHDSQGWFSVTRLVYIRGMLAAYVTTAADAVELGTREKDRGYHHRFVAALKIFQIAVDARFAGFGLGRALVDYIIQYARLTGPEVGWRYLTLDARPELVDWYAEIGFERNLVVQRQKVERALAAGRDVNTLPVSMRFDLLRGERR